MNTLINIVPTMLTFGGLTLVRNPGILAQSIPVLQECVFKSLTCGLQEDKCRSLDGRPMRNCVQLMLGFGT